MNVDADEVRNQSARLLSGESLRKPVDEETLDRNEVYRQATDSHPFVHRAHYHTSIGSNAHICDARGETIAIVMKRALPPEAARRAAEVLRPAATKTSLRANIFGGESPQSGIAGYFDYAGSPIEHKCRKTSFTSDNIEKWPGVFPMVDYVNALYRQHAPDAWKRQNAAIPDAFRVHGSVFSTLTINQRFRTAQHTDAGDFDGGFGMITVLEGDYDGLQLGFPRHGICVHMRVGDVMLFNTHQFHANTELERESEVWSRVTCVLYYRANLGAGACMRELARRFDEAKKAETKDEASRTAEEKEAVEAIQRFLPRGIVRTENGTNLNKPAPVFASRPSPLGMLVHSADTTSKLGVPPESLAAVTMMHLVLAGEIKQGSTTVHRAQCDGISDRGTSAQDYLTRNGDRLRGFLHELVVGAPLPLREEHETASFFFNDEQATSRAPLVSPKDSIATSGNIGVDTAPSLRARLFAAAGIAANFAHPARRGYCSRPEEELVPAFENLKNPPPAARAVSSLGGFTQSATAIGLAASNASFLSAEALQTVIPEGLFVMWSESRAKWLSLVKRDWTKQHARNPTRVDFTWANKSDMNQAFFDLCDVGSGVMLSLLDKEEAKPEEEMRFWLAFATHMHAACHSELSMPADAMSMRKLNVKLKDHRFGGTRYFKDQSPEEQARRLARKERIAALRRCNGGHPLSTGKKNESGKNWLEIDHFDYQTENRAVCYGETELLPDPELHARSEDATNFSLHAAHRTVAMAQLDESGPSTPVEPTCANEIRILVLSNASAGDGRTQLDVASKLRALDSIGQAELWRRLTLDGACHATALLGAHGDELLGELAASSTKLCHDDDVSNQESFSARLAKCTEALASALERYPGCAGETLPQRWTIEATVAPQQLSARGVAGDTDADARGAGYGSAQKRPSPQDLRGRKAATSAESDSDEDLLLGPRGNASRSLVDPQGCRVKRVRFVIEIRDVSANTSPEQFDAVFLRNAISASMSAEECRTLVAQARRFAKSSQPNGGAVLVQQCDAADPYRYMLPRDARAAADAASPLATASIQATRATSWHRAASGLEGAMVPMAQPVSLIDLQRLLLLPSSATADARIPSDDPSVDEFYAVYHLPRCSACTFVVVAPAPCV